MESSSDKGLPLLSALWSSLLTRHELLFLCHRSLATTPVLTSDQSQRSLSQQREIFASGHMLKGRYQLLNL